MGHAYCWDVHGHRNSYQSHSNSSLLYFYPPICHLKCLGARLSINASEAEEMDLLIHLVHASLQGFEGSRDVKLSEDIHIL